MKTDYLDNALSNFSGYIAVDEVYDGGTCILSLVDNRQHRRLLNEVLDHNPTHADIVAFFTSFRTELDKRGKSILGITTDGSPLYPEPIRQVFGSIPHQICVFHVIKEINKAVLKAVAVIRKELAVQKPEVRRGRPANPVARKASRKRKRVEKKIGELFEHRLLFVQHHLTANDRRTLRRITRGLPVLRKLRAITDEVYRLFDRRCRTVTALAKLKRLQRRISRFKTLAKLLRKVLSPSVEKALVFLDEKLLPSTSNAVERANRRFRKMQQAVYRVRAIRRIRQRIALDMQREWLIPTRKTSLKRLSLDRSHICAHEIQYAC